jgi:hypothetical protein
MSNVRRHKYTRCMLANSINPQLYPEWLAHVETPGAKDAFIYLVGSAATLRELSCHAQFKGIIRDFRFINAKEEQPFSFIVNRKWLLFYFRAPSVRSGKYSRATLLKLFPECRENQRNEWTVRLRSTEDVRSLLRYLELR